MRYDQPDDVLDSIRRVPPTPNHSQGKSKETVLQKMGYLGLFLASKSMQGGQKQGDISLAASGQKLD